jgi:CW-type Zinc Finger
MNRNRVVRQCSIGRGHPHFSEYVNPYCKCGLACAVYIRTPSSTTRACALGICDYTGVSSTPAQQCEGWIEPLTAADLTLQQIERMTAVWQLRHDMRVAAAAAQREQKAASKAAKQAAKVDRNAAKQIEKAVKIKLEKDVKVKLESGVQVKHEQVVKQEATVQVKRERRSNKRVKTEAHELNDANGDCPSTPPSNRVRVKTERAAAAAAAAVAVAAASDDWVQCERAHCHKWRRIAHHVDPASLPNQWYCNMNYWDTAKARCNVPEDFDDTAESDTEVAPRMQTKHEAKAAAVVANDDEIEDVTAIIKAQRVVHMLDLTNE